MVRLTDPHEMTIAVYCGCKTTTNKLLRHGFNLKYDDNRITSIQEVNTTQFIL